ncbi:GDSL-type esterase/lipase family protein [Amycolatopsis arida]|nr:GDSL-type esterase/lipase family protein [Amycolatopsis arida]
MRRFRWWFGGLVLVAVSVLVATFALLGEEPGPVDRPGPPGTGPLTVVTMGDSTLSGEGAGEYSPDTNGANGNWCHRSPNATVHHIQLPGVEARVNLACSGAPSAQVGLGEVEQWTEPSQAARLATLVKTHRVVAVVVAVGANDDPHFSRLMSDCFQAWFDDGGQPCSGRIRADWQQRLEAMVPKVVGALADIHKVLRDAGYRREDYQLVLQSYAAPIGPGIPEELRNLNGCPFRTEDLRWVSERAVVDLATYLHRAAAEAGARFLDLSRAGRGHEACTGGPDASSEWFSRLTVQWNDLTDAERARHAIQESFHPNAAGHTQFARCLSEFLLTSDPVATCRKGPDGNLHAATVVGPLH